MDNIITCERLEKNEILFHEWGERPWRVVRPLSDYKLSPCLCIHMFYSLACMREIVFAGYSYHMTAT